MKQKLSVIPAKAGTQKNLGAQLDPRLRGNDTMAYKSCDVYRLLDHLYAQQKDAPLFGDNIDPKMDLVAIHSHVTFGHKASGVQQVTHADNGQYNILLNHLNLAGMYGPLPDAYGEVIADRANQDMRDFLDIFHHRLMALMYRFYRKNRIFLGSSNMKETIVGKILHNLTGLSLFQKPFKFHETGLYPFFNLFWRNNPSVFGIQKLVGGYFRVQAQVTPFIGGWIYPDKTELSLFNTQYNSLGNTLFMGRKAWDSTYGLTLRLGPMNFEKYLSFIPPLHQNFEVLKDLLGYYIGNKYKVHVQLHLQSDTVPVIALGHKSFMNFTTWLTPVQTQIKDTFVTTHL